MIGSRSLLEHITIGATGLMLVLVAACSGTGEVPCDDDSDCFLEEACVANTCRPAMEAFNAAPEVCAAESGDTHDTTPVIQDVESEEGDNFGCSIWEDSQWHFVDGQVSTSASACPGCSHRYDYEVTRCKDQTITVTIRFEPEISECLHETWFDEIGVEIWGTPRECDPQQSVTDACYNFTDEGQAYEWELVFQGSTGTNEKEYAKLILNFSDHAEFDYTVETRVSEFLP